MLLGVCGEVLDAGAHIPALYAVDKGGRELAGQIRVFGEILKVSAAQGAALDVDRGAEHHGELLVLAGVAHGLTHAREHRLVKGGRRGAGCREADRLDAVVDAEMVGLVVLLAQTVGAVADHRCGNAETVHRLGVPEVPAGAEPGLFFQCQLRYECLDIHVITLHYKM